MTTLRTAALGLVAAALLPCPGISPAGAQTPSQISAVPIPAGQIERALGQIDALATEIQARSQVPGLAVAVVQEGRLVHARGFGVRAAGKPEPVDADTVFQLASVSKPICGTVIAHQVGIGAIAWETPVVGDLPWYRLADPWIAARVNIADLLSHRAGLPAHAGDDLEDLGFGRRDVLERLHQLPLAPFRASYNYTNFGFTAAAEAVAAVAGTDWETLSETVLYRPLGMASTSSRFADFLARPNRATGHVMAGGRFVAGVARQPDAQSPAGGVSSSVNDLARWMILLLDDGRFEGRQVIDAAALRAAMTAQAISAPSPAIDARPGFYGYGFGVGVSAAGRVEIKHSGGFALGAGTHVALLPSAGLGIVVLSNAWPVGAAEAVAAGFLDLVQLGAVQRDWLTAYGALLRPLIQPVGRLVGKARPADAVPPAPWSHYLGRYDNDYYGPAEITEADGGLRLTLGPARLAYPLSPWSGDTFTFQPRTENQPAGSISRAEFAAADLTGYHTLTIEYLNPHGLGTFTRR